MALPKLIVRIGADADQFSKTISSAEGRLNKFAGAAKYAGIAAAAAFAAGAVGLAVFARKQAQAIDDTTKMARSIGLTHNQFKIMAQVAGEAGVEMGALSSSIGLMQRNIIEMASGTAAQVDAFARLGVTFKDIAGLSPDEQFKKIAARLNEIEDPALRTATAMDIFGRSGRAIIGMLEDYSDKAADAAAFQDKFALSVSQVDAQTIEAAHDAFARVQDSLQGVGNMVASYVAPLVKHLSDQFLQSGASAEYMGNLGNQAMAFLGAEIDDVRKIIIQMQINIEEIDRAMAAMSENAIAGLVILAKGWNEVADATGAAKISLLDLQTTESTMAHVRSNAGNNIDQLKKELTEFVPIIERIKQIQEQVRSGMGGAPVSPGGSSGLGGLTGLGAEDKEATTKLEQLKERLASEELAEQESLQRRLDRLREFYLTDEQAAYAHGLNKIAVADEAREQGVIKEQEHGDLVAQINQDTADKITAIEAAKRNTMLGQTSSLFGALANLAQAGGKKTAGIAKAFGIAEALINTYVGATNALRTIPFPANFAAAAAVIANGLASVATIAGVNANGGANSASGGGRAGGAAAAAAAPKPLDVMIQGLQPNDLISGGQLSSLFDKLIDEAGDRGIRPMFAA